jgi:uncharacterized protein with PIN domain
MLGFDSLFCSDEDDSQIVQQALAEGRVLLTRDTGIMKRRLVTGGRFKAVLMQSEQPEQQMQQLVSTLDIKSQSKPFAICLECNQPLISKTPTEVKDRVPPYVYRTQTQYMECPDCRRIYWRGTHWQAMLTRLKNTAGIENQEAVR